MTIEDQVHFHIFILSSKFDIFHFSSINYKSIAERIKEKRILKRAWQNSWFCPINKEKEKPTNNQYQR